MIPLFNHQRYIAAAIESVLAQTRPPDCLVVVDDGSSDQSATEVERALEQAACAFPVELRRQPNQGAARTLNRTIASLDEDVVAILNSDDAWHPQRLEALLPLVPADRPGLAFSGVEFFGDASEADLAGNPRTLARLLSVARELPSAGFALLLGNFAISTGNLVFSRSLFDAVGGFDEELDVIHDWHFLVQSLCFAEPTLVPRLLYRYRIHGRNTYRVSPDSSGTDLARLHQSFFAWAIQGAMNPAAPIPAHYPKFFPFFLPVWLEFGQPRSGNVPLHLARLAARLGDSPTARPAEIQREAVRRTHALLKMSQREVDPDELDSLLADCAEHWEALAPRRSLHAVSVSQKGTAARFEWGGAAVTVGASEPGILDELAGFTGLAAIPQAIPLGRASLNAIGERDVYVLDQHRIYECPEDRLIWLALTVSEFLARDAGALLLHAASVALGTGGAGGTPKGCPMTSGVVLAMGEPLAGKSTLTLEALRRGLDVLGDDQVRLRPATALVQPLPRPVKLRLPMDEPAPLDLAHLRGHLDGEPTLMLRRSGSCLPPDRWLPARAIVHLSRRGDRQCTLEQIEDHAQIRDLIRAQFRGALAEHPDPFETVACELLRIPSYRLSVGVGRTAEALDLVAAALDASVSEPLSATLRPAP